MESKANTTELKTIKQKASVDSKMASKKDEVVAAASNAANAATKESSSLIGAASVSRKLKDVTNNLSKGEGARNDEKAAKTKKEATNGGTTTGGGTNGGTNGGTEALVNAPEKQRRRAPPKGPRNDKGKHIKMSEATKKRYNEDNSTNHIRITQDARKDSGTTFAFSVNDSVACGMSTFDPETQLLNFDADGFEGFCSAADYDVMLALTYFKDAGFERIGSAPLSKKAPFIFRQQEGLFIPNNNSSLRQIAATRPSARGAGTGAGSNYSSEEDLALVQYVNTHKETVINEVTDDDISSILPGRTVMSMRRRMKKLFKTDSFKKAIKTAVFQQILQQGSSSSTLTAAASARPSVGFGKKGPPKRKSASAMPKEDAKKGPPKRKSAATAMPKEDAKKGPPKRKSASAMLKDWTDDESSGSDICDAKPRRKSNGKHYMGMNASEDENEDWDA